MTPCPRAGRWFWGCRFEARYDTTPPSPEAIRLMPSLRCSFFDGDDIAALKVLRGYVYRLDVCTRCGATIERNRGND